MKQFSFYDCYFKICSQKFLEILDEYNNIGVFKLNAIKSGLKKA